MSTCLDPLFLSPASLYSSKADSGSVCLPFSSRADASLRTALRTFRQKKRQYRKFLEATPHFGAFVSQMKEDNERVANSLSKMEQALAGGGGGFGPSPSLEGGWTRGGSGVGGGGVKGSFQGGGGGRRGGIEMQALSGKEFENLVMEIAQLKKTNEQLASIVEQHTAKQEAAA